MRCNVELQTKEGVTPYREKEKNLILLLLIDLRERERERERERGPKPTVLLERIHDEALGALCGVLLPC